MSDGKARPGPPSETDPAFPDVVSVYRQHHAFVWRSLRAMGLGESAADDVLQEVFMVVHRRIRDYDPRYDMKGWLYGIARIKARSFHSKAAKRSKVEWTSDELPENLGHQKDKPFGDPISDPEQAVAGEQAGQQMNHFLDSLDEKQREVFSLIDIEECSAPEVAELLNIKLNTVYSRLRLARNKFEAFVARKQETQRRESGCA